MPLALGVLLFFGTAARAEEVPRHPPDRDDLMWMRKRHPEAAQKFEEGEALFAGARSPLDVERALTLLTDAAKEAPDSSLAYRRKCQALTALGRHDTAVKACDNAIYNNSTVYAIRAMVGAYMSGNEPPTASELGYAKLFARRLIQTAPDGPWGWAAHCDIALKLGDTDMLNECSDHLRKYAPDYYETQRVDAILATIRPGWGFVVGWVSLAALAFFAAVHAARRGSRRLSVRARRTGSVGALALLFSVPFARNAQAVELPAASTEPEAPHPPAGGFSKFQVDDADPKSSVPSAEERDKDPLQYGYFVMDLSSRAAAALKRNDHAAAARYFEAAVKAVPEAAAGFVRACEEYETLGDLDRATDFCAGALTGEGVALADYSHYARLAFSKKGELTQKDIGNLDAVVKHLVGIPEARSVGLDIQCQLGTRLGDEKRLSICAPALIKIAPDNEKSLFYGWTLSMHHQDFTSARAFADRAAKVAALPKEMDQARAMRRATIDAMPFWRKGFGFRDWRVGATTAVFLASILAFLLTRKSPAPGAPELKPPVG